MLRTKYLAAIISTAIFTCMFGIQSADDNTKRTSFVLANSLSLPFPVNETVKNEDSDFERTKKFDVTIEKFMQQWEIKGASFALMKDGKLIYAKGYGYADEDTQEPMEVKHLFRIASVSKLITATGIMKLVEYGILSLDDCVFGENGILNEPVFRTYKDKKFEQITIEHLLRHKGGFSARQGDPMFFPLVVAHKMNVAPPADLSTMIQFVLSRNLYFKPGTTYSYSNIGYGILSKVIEKVSGMGYEDFIRENVALPAGCFEMYMGRNFYEDKYPNEVHYYQSAVEEEILCCDGREILVPKYYGGNNIEGLVGAGAWVTSPVELLRFLSVIDGDPTIPDILQPGTIELMTSADKDTPIGWMSVYSDGSWVRTGSLSGSSAMMKRQSDGYSWVFLTNTSAWKGAKFTKHIDYLVSRAVQNVAQWPEFDLFELQNIGRFSAI
ncbi:hypothetical protein FACS1894195_2220 [Bacteroidia bacterium]|nr:hypothetical protein FACS1894195_2220 [Bacteroidia bacterium]